jgi:hypothetical protein
MFLIFAFLQTFVFAADAPKPVLGLVEGEYEVRSGPPDCTAGDLVFVKDRDKSATSISLGASSLVNRIEIPEFTVKENGCEFKYTNKLTGESLLNTSQVKCGKNGNWTTKTTVQKTEKGFYYSITVEDAHGKVEKTFGCTLALKK